jgi:isoleucyl-tRNA synthetase
MWFTYADFRRKMYAAPSVYEQVAEAYKKIRFTCRFMLQNLADFNPATDRVPYAEMLEVDRWALGRVSWLVSRMTEAFDNWDLHLFYHEVHGFCVTDLSAFYFSVLKDRLYTEAPAGRARRSAQTALWEILQALTRMIAPVLAFTAEDVWQQCRKLDETLPESVQMALWPEIPAEWDQGGNATWEQFAALREQAMQALEALKASGECENPLEAQLEVQAVPAAMAALEPLQAELAGLLVVSEVVLQPLAETPEGPALVVTARRNAGEKCERCWMRLPSVGDDADHPTLCGRCAGHVRALGV